VNTQQQQKPAEILNFAPSQPRHCIFCGELLEDDTDSAFDEDCEGTMGALEGLGRLLGISPQWDEYRTAIAGAGILITGEDNEVDDSVDRILLALSQGLDTPEQQSALIALKHLGHPAMASHIGSTLCVDGYSASQDPAFLTFEEGELRLSCEARKKASKLLREDLNGEWIDTDRIFAFVPKRETAMELLRVCSIWYPLVQLDDEFLALVENDEFMQPEEDNEPDPEPESEPNPELAAFGEGLAEGIAEGHPAVDALEDTEGGEEPGMQTAEDLDQDQFTQMLSEAEKPLTRKAFRELAEMASKYDLAMADLAAEDIKDPHLARLWEVYMASVGTALVADIAIDQYLDDRKAASEAAESVPRRKGAK
jgi:hypothetical protein